MQDKGSAPAAAGQSVLKPYRVKQVAALLDVHPTTVYRAIGSGALVALRIGRGNGGLRITRASLDAFLAAAATAQSAVSAGVA